MKKLLIPSLFFLLAAVLYTVALVSKSIIVMLCGSATLLVGSSIMLWSFYKK